MLRNVSISNFTAYNTGNCCSSITGIPGYYVENISLSHVTFLCQGGTTRDACNTDIKEDEQGYPEAIA